MTVRWRLPSGLEIFGLPTRNAYGGHWDLGPTWNYAVLTDRPFLVDSGRFGQGNQLIGMMESVGINAQDLEFVLISHGHEDHDGGLAELVNGTHLSVKAHAVYEHLIKTYPAQSPESTKSDFPAKCWHCPMPESFYTQNCLEYHQVLQGLKVDPVGDGETEIGPDVHTYHLPGHSPDCLAVRLGLEGLGSFMAANEIVSHCELLIESEDVVAVDGNGYAATGGTQFETFIENLRSD
jgi:glyoxylase-like metal-dependent hydrolase (beta-lactamase superfamily II)